jgi:GTP1/Obg family GTP-binding protein
MCDVGDRFKSHLAQIKFAREKTSEIFANFELSMGTAMASLSRAWEMLFDSICGDCDGSVGELKDISAVIQKLSASSQRIQEMERKQSEKLRSGDIEEEMQRLRAVRESMQMGRLPKDVVETVEEQLQLL